MSKYRVISPVDNSLVGEFNFSTKEDIDSIILSKPRSLTKVQKRRVLDRLISLLDDSKERLAKAITYEMGKPIAEARVEVDRTINTALCSRDYLGNLKGEVVYADSYMDTDKKAIVERVDIGVVLAITPFNFPINLCIHKLGPSFLANNLTIIKPNPQNFFSTKLFVDLCHDAGMGEEYVQMICPDVPVLQELIKSDSIDCISFTGGTKSADSIASIAGRKKLLFELGGNDPLIVNKDADIEKAVDTLITQRIGTCGQRCTAAKRTFLHTDIYESFKSNLLSKLSKIKSKNAFEDDCLLGPLVSKESALKVYNQCLNYQKLNSVKFILLEKPRAAYIDPILAECSSLEDEAFYDEVFGPVISLFTFSDNNLGALVNKVNSTGYGLQSGIFTNDLSFIQRMYKDLKVGSVNINEGSGFRAENIPFGGVSKSGQGREGVEYAYKELTSLKNLII